MGETLWFFFHGKSFRGIFRITRIFILLQRKTAGKLFSSFASRRKCRCIVFVVKIKIRLERMKIFFQRLIESKKFTSAQSFFLIRLSTSHPLVVNKEREETREEEEEEEEEKKEINTLPMS